MNAGAGAGSGSVGALGGALRYPPFAVLFIGYVLSALGDGMAVVAIPWLAIPLSGGQHTGLLIGASIAAYTLPGVIAGFALGRVFSRWDGRLLILGEATLRAGALGATAVLARVGVLTPAVYVILLGISSLLVLGAITGELTSVTELLPASQHVAGNSLLTFASFATTMVGPALAGVLIDAVGAGTVIGFDAASYLILIGAVAISRRLHPPPAIVVEGHQSMAAALRSLLHHRSVLGISVLCVVFFGLYGPVEVALPLYVSATLHASATVLGGYWAAFAVGATVGAVGASLVARFGLWKVSICSMLGWGACLVPFGFAISITTGFAALAIGGLIYGPFEPIKRALIQQHSPAGSLASLGAASALITTPAAPLGTAIGGPLVSVLGPSSTLELSGLGTIAAALAATVILRTRLPSAKS